MKCRVEQLPEFVSGCMSNDPETQFKCIQRIRELLSVEHEPSISQVASSGIRASSNVLIADQNHGYMTQYLLHLGLLNTLRPLITSENVTIQCEALRTISVVTSGSKEQIEAVIAYNLFQPLINILKTEKYEISIHALRAVNNATSGGSEQQIAFLVNQGVIPPLCQFLKNVKNKKILMMTLEAIENILKVGKAKADRNQSGRNQFAEYVVESGGVDYLEQLTLADFIQWMGSASRKQQILEMMDFDWVLSMEQSMKVMLSGYGRFQGKMEDGIPDDLLRMIMRSVTGSTLDEYLNQESAASKPQFAENH